MGKERQCGRVVLLALAYMIWALVVAAITQVFLLELVCKTTDRAWGIHPDRWPLDCTGYAAGCANAARIQLLGSALLLGTLPDSSQVVPLSLRVTPSDNGAAATLN